jgi:hypothetical protein
LRPPGCSRGAGGHVAAHDLRAPLNTAVALLRLLKGKTKLEDNDRHVLSNKNPTAAFPPGDEKALEYVRSVAASAVKSACTMVVIVDLPANQINIHVLNKGMCFVATAACGDPFAPEVIALSAFRDDVLLRNPIGRLFVRLYYAVSPPVAAAIAGSTFLRRLAMWTLVKPFAHTVATLRDVGLRSRGR